jgi:predicted SprT family Zn-dependent metalloprotease
MDSINKANFNQEIFIRNQSHSIIEAINRQLAHYSYHIGQIVFLGRMIKGQSWISLSLPKGKSVEYNKVKFSKGKHKGHFTDDLITDLKNK